MTTSLDAFLFERWQDVTCAGNGSWPLGTRSAKKPVRRPQLPEIYPK